MYKNNKIDLKNLRSVVCLFAFSSTEWIAHTHNASSLMNS